MARMIKFASICYKCGKTYQKGEAYLQRVNGKWMCHCIECHKNKQTLKP